MDILRKVRAALGRDVEVSRSTWILASLLFIGLTSVLARIEIQPNYTWTNAILDISYEALPAALLFLIIEKALGGYERQQESLKAAQDQLTRGNRDERIRTFESLLESSPRSLGSFVGADLEYLEAAGAGFAYGSFAGADLDHLKLTDCSLKRISFGNSSIRAAVLDTVTVDACDFSRADLTGTLVSGSTFSDQCEFASTILTDVRFSGCSFAPGVVSSMSPSGSIFIGCDLTSEERAYIRENGGRVEGGINGR